VDPSFAHYYEAMRSVGFAGQKAAALELLAEAAAAAPGGKVRNDEMMR
jgi:hypothetical protein